MPDPLAGVPGEELFSRGVQVARMGDHVRAEQYFTAAMERGYPRDEVMPWLLRACLAGGRLSAALQHAVPYLQEHPDQWSLRYLVATLHIGLGDPHAARVQLEQVIRDAPDEAPAYYTLGMLLWDSLHEPAQGRDYLQRYLELAPSGAHAPEVRAVIEARPLQVVPTDASSTPTPETSTGEAG